MKRKDTFFTSGGLRCSAWLYLPDAIRRPPVVVMAHGLAAQKDFGLQAYAERFVEAGLACLVFDYRHFGESEGEPRNLVNPWMQLKDWSAAVEYARGLEEVDGSRIGLWGTSFSGGHVLVTAARTPRIRAVVAQVPFVDGLATALGFPPSYQLRGLMKGLLDGARLLTRKAPHTVRAVGEPGTFALMNTPECMAGYLALVPKDTAWKNEVPARFTLMVPFYRPTIYAGRITCPALVVYARRDSLIPSRAVERTAARIPRAEVVALDAGHFDVYTEPLFGQVSRRQASFLAEHLEGKGV